MPDLLDLAAAGHGGRPRWAQLSRFSASVTITGAIRALMGRPGVLDDVLVEGATRVRRLTMIPSPRPGGSVARPHRQPPGVDGPNAWDECRIATFTAEELWPHFVTPFIFGEDDIDTEETWPWREDAQIWRALLVTYPDPLEMHSRRQTYYFDGAGLLRRLDYDLNCPGGGPAVHYPSRYREFDGIMVPTHRVVYPRGPDGDPDRSVVSVDIDVSKVTFR